MGTLDWDTELKLDCKLELEDATIELLDDELATELREDELDTELILDELAIELILDDELNRELIDDELIDELIDEVTDELFDELILDELATELIIEALDALKAAELEELSITLNEELDRKLAMLDVWVTLLEAPSSPEPPPPQAAKELNSRLMTKN